MNSQLIEVVTPTRARSAGWARRHEWRLLMVGLAILDALVLGVTFYCAYTVRFSTGWELFREGWLQPEFYTLFTLILIPFWLGLYWLYGVYNPRNLFGGTQEYMRVFNACSIGLVLVIVITFLQPEIVVARAWLLLAWFFTVSGTIGARFVARRFVYALRRRGHLHQRVVILGANAEGRAVAAQLGASPNAGATIVGFVDDDLPIGGEVLPGVPVLGSVRSFEAIVEQTGADTAIIADTAMVRDKLAAVYGAMEALRRLEVCLAPGLFELLTIGVQVREQGSVPLLTLNKTRITGLHALTKNLIDRVGAGLGLLLLSPLFALVALLIHLDSPGPIIYRRRVVGASNRTFDAFKFRTMRVDGEALLTPELKAELRETGKLKDDPRITPLGRFLRRTSIDELPQLVNVFLGQMSLVGPRMITVDELHHFGRWRHNLVTVRPGLTGLWQISGRSNLGYEDRVRLDMHYIRNYSIWLDLYIIFRTITVVITGQGAF
jgi:exopolysaccharide biosynthesis polyprenyl glycosylphosphotransferase